MSSVLPYQNLWGTKEKTKLLSHDEWNYCFWLSLWSFFSFLSFLQTFVAASSLWLWSSHVLETHKTAWCPKDCRTLSSFIKCNERHKNKRKEKKLWNLITGALAKALRKIFPNTHLISLWSEHNFPFIHIIQNIYALVDDFSLVNIKGFLN